MATVVDVIEKLIQLALHNPSEIEAASAAMKVVRLLDSHQVPIGANIVIARDVQDYTPPTAEENATIEELLKKKGQDPDKNWSTEYTGRHHEGKEKGLITQDNSPQTAADAFRPRLGDAWGAVRGERQR